MRPLAVSCMGARYAPSRTSESAESPLGVTGAWEHTVLIFERNGVGAGARDMARIV